jgi:hypothetical protein
MRNFRSKLRYCLPANPQGASMTTVPWGSFCAGCIHRRTLPGKRRDSNGYCAALNVGDWMRGEFGPVWDGVKICHIRGENEPPERPLHFAERPRFDQPWGGWTVIYDRDRPIKQLPPRRAGWRQSPDPIEWLFGRRIR